MSTYLLAWAVGEMHHTTAKTKNNVEVSVWATPAQPTAALDFPLEIAVRTIEFYEDSFGIPYPLPMGGVVFGPISQEVMGGDIVFGGETAEPSIPFGCNPIWPMIGKLPIPPTEPGE